MREGGVSERGVSGRVALVTGASQGIGAAVARRLLDGGFTVVNVSRAPAAAHARMHDVVCDLLDADATERAAALIAERFAVTHVVHNAGLVWPNLVEDVTADEMRGMMRIHVDAPLALTQPLLPHMRERGGRIVFVTSRAAQGVPTRTAYGASKAAVHSMVRTWALELGPHGITVNAVAPGPVLTDNFWSIIPKGSERERTLADALPVRRLGTVDDVAHAVMFMLHDDAGFTTGQVLHVCGGASVGTVQL